jgi:hypothetical protein
LEIKYKSSERLHLICSMGWTIGVLGFDSRRGLGIFLFTTASRTALGPTQPFIQWVPDALPLGVKRFGREANHSPPSSSDVKECVELCLNSPSTSSWRGVQVKKHRDNFTFTFIVVVLLSVTGQHEFPFKTFSVCLLYKILKKSIKGFWKRNMRTDVRTGIPPPPIMRLLLCISCMECIKVWASQLQRLLCKLSTNAFIPTGF